MGVERTIVDMDRLWNATAPVRIDLTLSQYFENTLLKAAHKENSQFLTGFLSDWKATHDGKPPLLNPQLRYKMSA